MIGQQGRDAGRKQGRWLASAVHGACRTGRRTFFEALESRQLLSATFTYDLRLAPGQEAESADGHSVDLSQPHADTYTLQLWGQITGDTNLSNDLFSCGYVSIASTQVNGYGALAGGGITDGEVDTALFPLIPSNAAAANLTDDGVSDWGSNDTRSATGWMFWANADQHANGMGYQDGTVVPGLSEPAASDPTNTWEVLIATFTVDVSSLAAPDNHYRSTEFDFAMSPNWIVEGNALVYRADGSIASQVTGLIGQGVSFDLQSAAPAANDFSKSLLANTSQAFSASDFETAYSDGPLGGSLQAVRIDALPPHGQLTLDLVPVAAGQEITTDQLGSLVYTPDADYFGADSITWSGFDGTVFTQTEGTVSLADVDPPPVVGNFSISLAGGTSHRFAASDFTGVYSDADPAASLESITVNLPMRGYLTLGGASVTPNELIPVAQFGELVYTPWVGWTGSDSYSWTASNGMGTSNSGSVNITIQQTPVIYDTYYGMNSGDTYILGPGYFANYFTPAPDGAPLESVTIVSLPQSGQLLLDGQAVTVGESIPLAATDGLSYASDAGFSGRDGFAWQAFDGVVSSGEAAHVYFDVSPAEPGPTLPPVTDPGGGAICQSGSTVVSVGIISLPQLAVPFAPGAPGGGFLAGDGSDSATSIFSATELPPPGGQAVAEALAKTPGVAVQPMAPLAPALVWGGPIVLVSGVELGSSTAPSPPIGGDARGAPPAVVQESPVFIAPALPLSAVSTLNTLTQTVTIASGDALSPALGELQRALDGLAG